jgi:peroxiredoxin
VRTLLILLTLTALAGITTSSFADSRDWSLNDTHGEKFTLSETLGEQPVLLIFWATWCAPCKKEMADNARLFNAYADKGVLVLLVSQDNQKSQAKVKPYIESKGITHRVLLDPNSEVLKRYGGSKIPFTVLLDKTGNAVLKHTGEMKDMDKLTKQIDELLGASK